MLLLSSDFILSICNFFIWYEIPKVAVPEEKDLVINYRTQSSLEEEDPTIRIKQCATG
jgi:hypothetical protein